MATKNFKDQKIRLDAFGTMRLANNALLISKELENLYTEYDYPEMMKALFLDCSKQLDNLFGLLIYSLNVGSLLQFYYNLDELNKELNDEHD